MMFFKKRKSEEELAHELRETRNQRIAAQGRSNLVNKLSEEKDMLRKANHRGESSLLGNILSGINKAGKHMADNMKKEDEAKRRGKFRI